MKIFGFELGKSVEVQTPSPVIPNDVDITVSSHYGVQSLTFVTNTKSDSHKTVVIQNRELANQPEVDYAVDEIVNEMVDSAIDVPFEITFVDNTGNEISKKVKDSITDSFRKVSVLYSKDIVKDLYKWYVDGSSAKFIRLSEDGKSIQALEEIDPWLIEKITPAKTARTEQGVTTLTKEEPYYVYSQPNMTDTDSQLRSAGQNKIKLAYDSVIFADSGKYDEYGIPSSYIRSAMKPINDMLTLENAGIIYRMTRAPEKRAFYVDTGQLPTQKAEEYVKTLMNRFKTKIDYDSKTGEIKTANRNLVAATEDYWMPRRGGSSATEIQMISETSNQLNTLVDELDYFKKKAYRALKIPTSRINDNPTFNLGSSGNITREEVKFSMYIDRLQRQYTIGLYHLLMVELMITGVMSKEEFIKIKDLIKISMINNDFFSETKKFEVLTNKVTLISSMEQYVGTYFSQQYVLKEVLGMTDEEIDSMLEEIQNPLIKKESDESNT
jgi:polyhydroxyalkanoate synthesis regulator phasin